MREGPTRNGVVLSMATEKSVQKRAADWIEEALRHVDFHPTNVEETAVEDEFCATGENLVAELRRR